MMQGIMIVAPPNDPWSGLGSGRRRYEGDLEEAVERLKYADLWRIKSGIAENGDVRIDVQGPWSEDGKRIGFNIQAQVARVTIAAIRVSSTLEDGRATLAQQAAVLNAVRAAITAAFHDGNWRNVIGDLP